MSWLHASTFNFTIGEIQALPVSEIKGPLKSKMLPAMMDDPPAIASTKPRSTDFSIAAIMSKEISNSHPHNRKSQSSSPPCFTDSPTKSIGKEFKKKYLKRILKIITRDTDLHSSV